MVRRRCLAALALALLPLLARAQDIPAQCDPATVMTPRDLSFFGPAQSVRIGPINYSYHLFGEAKAKPPLVLITGMGTTQYSWPIEVLEELSKTRQVLTFDNALVGLSVDTQAAQRSLTLTVPWMAASTMGLIRAMNFTSKPDLLGVSMGGTVAQTIAATYGTEIRSVVSVASSYGGRDAPQPEGGIGNMLDYLASEAGANDFSLLFPQGTDDPGYCNILADWVSLQFAAVPGWMNLTGAGYGAGTVVPSVEATLVSLETRRKQADALRLYFAGAGTLGRLSASANQLLFMAGSQDRIFPTATQYLATAGIPDSWVVTVPDASHGLPYQHPAQFARQVLTFLDGSQAVDPGLSARFYSATNAAAAASLALPAAVAAAAVILAALA